MWRAVCIGACAASAGGAYAQWKAHHCRILHTNWVDFFVLFLCLDAAENFFRGVSWRDGTLAHFVCTVCVACFFLAFCLIPRMMSRVLDAYL